MDYNHVENLVTRFIEEDDLEAKEELIKSFMPFIKKFSKSIFIYGYDKYDIENMYATSEDMKVHKDMIEKLILSYGRRNTLEEAEKHITEYVNNTCINILKNTAVFKEDEQGQKALKKFLTSINL